MTDEEGPIPFNSRSKAPYDKFSNFYEVELKMPEGVFGSVEHYFQAMKFVDKNHPRFEMNGDLGKRRFDSGNWKETVSRGRFIKSAGGKSGTQKYKLTLRRNGLDRERGKQKMKESLQKKFECDPFKSLLLKTGKRKLVHIPMRGKTDYWTGRVDKVCGDINGENTMGELLMEVRHELQEVEKCAEDEDNNIGTIQDEVKKEFAEEAGDDIKDENKGKEENKGDDDIKNENKGDDVIKEKDEGDDDIRDENKGDDDIEDENKGDDDIVDDGQKDDDESTSEPKGFLANKGKKRKHKDNDPQVENLDQEVSEGPIIKRKKIEEKSKDVFQYKKGCAEDKGISESSSEHKSKKRKLVDDDVQEECSGKNVPEGLKLKRKKVDQKSKEDNEKQSDGKESAKE